MKVYIIHGSSGVYGSRADWICSVHTNKEFAEKKLEKLVDWVAITKTLFKTKEYRSYSSRYLYFRETSPDNGIIWDTGDMYYTLDEYETEDE